jgi:plastocyanin
MNVRALVAALALPLFIIVFLPADDVAGAAGAAPRVHTVLIEGMRFQPEGLTVAPGDTVVWLNRDMVPHTATSASGRFDSNEIAPGKSWTHTVRATGEFNYICTYHPLMKAILRVR